MKYRLIPESEFNELERIRGVLVEYTGPGISTTSLWRIINRKRVTITIPEWIVTVLSKFIPCKLL